MTVKKDIPELDKLFDVIVGSSIITIYRDRDGDLVIGGIGWYERFEWERMKGYIT